MQIAWTNTETTIGGGSTNPSLTITLSQCDFYDWTPNYVLDEIVTQDVTFKAQFDLDGNDDMINSIALVNGKTSY